MKKNRLAAITTVLLFGFGLFFFSTDGFQSFTAENARTQKLIKEKPAFPDVTLQDSKNRTYAFDTFKGKYVLITFIYTACTDVCPKIEMNMADVYKQIPKKYMGKDIVFLSISFDPERDNPQTLEKYRHSYDSDGDTWRMARITNKQELDNLLDAFGVVVIPDDSGNFTHNAAFYLVGPDGKLDQVMDYQKTDDAARQIKHMLRQKGGEVAWNK
ncbi:SCO family protein [Virgibacillus halophilus]|uniref:SCO family protein n=1 Tax=Tigheibacillus halophilus TaxID=361280 RepID=A0ABU5C9Q5_9BACI|nr:SCO family protein [Virgibacillus halophilus]